MQLARIIDAAPFQDIQQAFLAKATHGRAMLSQIQNGMRPKFL
jgi:hypothetical protein